MANTRSSGAPRISAGAYRGRKISVPPGLTVRPTRALVRRALFDMLGERVDGARVLDLYSGSGLLGIEALSRGALHVTFVERQRAALVALRDNLAHCGVPPARATVLPLDVDAVRFAHVGPEPLDLILCDPPFRRAELPPVLLAIDPDAPLQPHVALALHLPSSRPAEPVLGPWRQTRVRTHGRSTIALYELAPGSLKKT